MNASIDTNGRLTITGSNENEKYALKVWYANFQQGDESSTLNIPSADQ